MHLLIQKYKFHIFKVIIWDAIEYNKVCEFKEAHRRGVLSAIFDENDNTVSGGGDSLIKILKS